MRAYVARATLVVLALLDGVSAGSIAAAADHSVPIDTSRFTWLQCIRPSNGDDKGRYFGYFVFDKARNILRNYDQIAYTVVDLHAQVDEDTISWSTVSDVASDIQALINFGLTAAL